jgi:hypothetical protein
MGHVSPSIIISKLVKLRLDFCRYQAVVYKGLHRQTCKPDGVRTCKI